LFEVWTASPSAELKGITEKPTSKTSGNQKLKKQQARDRVTMECEAEGGHRDNKCRSWFGLLGPVLKLPNAEQKVGKQS
jgi:hypothetical protein